MSEEVRVGAGGWGYFSGGLRTYSRAFDFVEVNSTFYRLPRTDDVLRWRRSVPESFSFSVKASKGITHVARPLDNPGGRELLAQTTAICRSLRAPWLVLEFPPWREFDDASCAALKNLLSAANVGATACIEARAYRGKDLPPKLAGTIKDLGGVDVTDPLIQDPRVESDTAYMRVFGKGEHNVYQPTDEELEDVDERTSERGLKFMVLAFHGIKMYKDAARFVTFKKSGKFPKATRGEGVSSLDEVLREDARFPATREDLIDDQGWKLIDLAEAKRVRVSVLLRQLGPGTYSSRREVIAALASR